MDANSSSGKSSAEESKLSDSSYIVIRERRPKWGLPPTVGLDIQGIPCCIYCGKVFPSGGLPPISNLVFFQNLTYNLVCRSNESCPLTQAKSPRTG